MALSFYDKFYEIYENLPIACCICDGLEILATNKQFKDLAIFGKAVEGSMLSELIENSTALDNLLEFGEAEIILSAPKNEIYENFHFICRSFVWQFCRHFHLITISDESAFYGLGKALQCAYHYDLSTQLFLPQPFCVHLSSLFETSKTSGLLCILLFTADNEKLLLFDEYHRSEFLIRLADLLRAEFSTDCIICRHDRLGITIFIHNIGNGKNLINQIEMLAVGLLKQQKVFLRLSIGAASYPLHGKNYEDLHYAANLSLRHSLKLQENKIAELSCVNYYSHNLQLEQQRRCLLAGELESALRSGRVCAWFQPILSGVNGAILSFEALVRWQHQKFGLIMPHDILSIARSNGLTHLLTSYMLEQSAKQFCFWPSGIKFAINVSAWQLTSCLVDLVRNMINRTDIEPERLEIEITEDALIGDFVNCSRTIARLRSMGVSIAMDDFGSGYTSFDNLRNLHFDKIKIDKSLCDGLPNDSRANAIVASIIAMAKKLNISVVAEGIERVEQLEFLRKFNCGIQGFIYCLPLSPLQLSKLRHNLSRSKKGEFIVPLKFNSF